jgi:hypothetical protein
MLEVLLETIVDSIKLLPFLFLAYLLIEFIENKAQEKTTKAIEKSGKYGPIIGALLGIIPQCGFSAAAANLYVGRVITLGTLISIFLSTSDEMLPVLISKAAPIGIIIEILLIKIFIGMVCGIVIDLLIKHKEADKKEEIHKLCHDEHCHCEESGIFKSSIKHTLQIFVYIFIVSLILNYAIHYIGEERLASLILNIPILGTIISGLIGLIPNCASSVILTELYLENILSIGAMIAGLLVNSGIGVLVLFKVNKNLKENITILGILYIIGIVSGILIDFIV